MVIQFRSGVCQRTRYCKPKASAALRNQFQQNGVQLGDGARVIVQEAKKKWRVIDTDSAYRIQYENDILSVYGALSSILNSLTLEPVAQCQW